MDYGNEKMFCGTGKTPTALWALQRLWGMEGTTAAPVKDVVAFAPTIKLVSQTAEARGRILQR